MSSTHLFAGHGPSFIRLFYQLFSQHISDGKATERPFQSWSLRQSSASRLSLYWTWLLGWTRYINNPRIPEDPFYGIVEPENSMKHAQGHTVWGHCPSPRALLFCVSLTPLLLRNKTTCDQPTSQHPPPNSTGRNVKMFRPSCLNVVNFMWRLQFHFYCVMLKGAPV